jgi:hypothetical protein
MKFYLKPLSNTDTNNIANIYQYCTAAWNMDLRNVRTQVVKQFIISTVKAAVSVVL